MGIIDTNSFKQVDIESLPIVKELKEELEKVTEEKDAAVSCIKLLIEKISDGYNPQEICKEICKNYDVKCCKCADIGRFDECRGFEWIGIDKE